jgi:hypothetical protein
MKLWLVRSHTILIIIKKVLFLNNYIFLYNHWLSRSWGMRQAWKLAHKKIPKSKTTYVQMHARDSVLIVGAIEKHRISQDWDKAWRSQGRTHDDDESARAAAASDGESEDEKRHE